MKGKILVGLLLWVIGAIYVFLVYPLLQNAPDVTSSKARIIGDIGVIPASEPRSSISPMDSGSSPEWQTSDIQKAKPVASNQQLEADTICFDDICFTIDIADTPALRAQWLMHRESLDMDAGMLFVFDRPGSYSFWMKNTLIPLDIIWLDENLIVLDTATMQPCLADPCPSYHHQWLAMYALEINAWLVEQYNIQIWDLFIQQ